MKTTTPTGKYPLSHVYKGMIREGFRWRLKQTFTGRWKLIKVVTIVKWVTLDACEVWCSVHVKEKYYCLIFFIV